MYNSINFVLSYQNTNLLKEDEVLSQNFSVRYDIWFNDVVSLYNELNSVLADVQTSTIVGHEFIEGYRVPDKDEILKDMYTLIDGTVLFEEELIGAADDVERQKLLDARKQIEANKTAIEKTVYTGYYNAIVKLAAAVDEYDQVTLDGKAAAEALTAARNALTEAKKGTDQALIDECQAAYDAAVKANNDLNKQKGELLNQIRKDAKPVFETHAKTFVDNAYKIEQMYQQSIKNMQYLRDNSNFSEEFLAEIEANITATTAIYDDVIAKLANVSDMLADLRKRLAAISVVVSAFEMPKRPADNNVGSYLPIYMVSVKTDRYYSDDNKIVLLTYENGKTFILNFNSFDITTKIGDTVYTVSAYGYVVVK